MNVSDYRIRLAALAAITLTCEAAAREPHFRVQEISLGRAATSVSVLDLNDDGKPYPNPPVLADQERIITLQPA